MSRTIRAFQSLCLLTVGVLVGRWSVAIDTVSAQVPSKNGQKEFLIGNVPIHLGDPKGSLLSVLRKQYKVEDRGAEFFLIDDSTSVLGSVRFMQD